LDGTKINAYKSKLIGPEKTLYIDLYLSNSVKDILALIWLGRNIHDYPFYVQKLFEYVLIIEALSFESLF